MKYRPLPFPHTLEMQTRTKRKKQCNEATKITRPCAPDWNTRNDKKEPGLSEDILQRILNTSTDWGLGYQGGIVTHTKDGDRIAAHIPGLVSDTPEGLWTKMTFLAQCVYPYYRSDGKMKEQPFVRVRIGDFYDVVGIIESVSVELSVSSSLVDVCVSCCRGVLGCW